MFERVAKKIFLVQIQHAPSRADTSIVRGVKTIRQLDSLDLSKDRIETPEGFVGFVEKKREGNGRI